MKTNSLKAGLLIWLFFFAGIAGTLAQPVKANKKNAAAVSERTTLSDSALLDLVQKQTFKYFWDFAHPVSGLARERSNKAYGYGHEVVTTGGSGFGIMAIIVATERHWISRDTAVKHLLKTVNFL
jgi:hypothetical protein